MYKGDLVLKEIPYPKRKIKWSYDIIEDKHECFGDRKTLTSRVVLRHIIKGYNVELIDDDGNTICFLKSDKR